MRFPFARALRMPALTSSTISERCSSATAPRTVKTIFPAGVEVSICSEKETKSIPREGLLFRSSTGAQLLQSNTLSDSLHPTLEAIKHVKGGFNIFRRSESHIYKRLNARKLSGTFGLDMHLSTYPRGIQNCVKNVISGWNGQKRLDSGSG